MFFGRKDDPKDLLNDSESPDKDKRKEALDKMKGLDENHPEIQARLELMEKSDSDKGVRKKAKETLKELKKKPMGGFLFKAEETKSGGSDGSGFDNEVGDSSLEEGEMDVESDLSKQEEDRREMEAEGKGIYVTLKEKNQVTINHQGITQATGKSTGKIEVSNSGSKNRINGIDLYLKNVDKIQSDGSVKDHTHIGMIKPGDKWSRLYEYESEFDVILITQEFLDPETELSPNFLAGEKTFENRIKITNTLNNPITNIRGKKILNENASLVATSGDNVSFNSSREEVTEKKMVGGNTSSTDTIDSFSDEDEMKEDDTDYSSDDEEVESYENQSSPSSSHSAEYEDVTRTSEVVNFTIEEIGAGETVEIVITLKASLPDEVPVYTAGGLIFTYDTIDSLTSELEFDSVDGVSDIKQRIRKKQRETEPNMYDAEVTFENLSEFVYQIKEFEVREGDINGPPILEWKGKNASEDEREIVPGEKTVFEFVYDDKDRDGNPAFGQHLEFEVQEYHNISSEYTLEVPSEDLKFMALNIKKAYVDENDEETTEIEIPSFVETEIFAKVWVTGIGTYPLDNIEIVEEIPEGFDFSEAETIKVFRNGTEVSSDQYEVTFGEPQGPKNKTYTSTIDSETGEADEKVSEPVTKEDLAGGSRLQVNLNNLQETTDGSFGEGEEFIMEYSMTATALEPNEKPIKTYTFTEGYTNDMPESKVHAEISDEDGLQFVIVHVRDDLDIGKYVSADSEGYVIELEAENNGTSVMTLTIKDMIPNGFTLVDGSMVTEPAIETDDAENVKDGNVYTWIFENVEPQGLIKVSYKLHEDSVDAEPRMLQKLYQG